MTTICSDPEEFADDQLAGFLDLHADRLSGVTGGVVAHRTSSPRVAVVLGGGSGHYPAFHGLVGRGLATAAVVGNVFTSPSAARAWSVARAADEGRGVVFCVGRYAGDAMNFGIAVERLRREGVDARLLMVTDDVASSDVVDERRGIAGLLAVVKAMGAAAERGADVDEVERVGRAANAATRTLGVTFAGCSLPGSTGPLFTVPAGHLGLGLGIHGEPGIADVPLPAAPQLAALLVDRLLDERPSPTASAVAPVLNGLGATGDEELFLLWHEVAGRLRDAVLRLVAPAVGSFVTSLDMAGVSLSLQWLDDELERLWTADCDAPGLHRSRSATEGLRPALAAADEADDAAVPDATDAAVALGHRVRSALGAARDVVVLHEDDLGRIDAVAGDGDHGRGMVKGARAAVARIDAVDCRAGGAWLLTTAGRAWAAAAGGTSGVLWGAALEAAGATLTDGRDAYPSELVVDAVDAFAEAVVDLGRAAEGDKTLLDALLPFARALRSGVTEGVELGTAWAAAAAVATTAAAATAELRPRVGRARPLAEKSLGTPDAGATSMALVLTAVGAVLAGPSDPALPVTTERTPS